MQYDKRWRVEIFFSALKGTVGEVIMANKPVYQIQEAVMKIYAYFLMRKNTVVNCMVVTYNWLTSMLRGMPLIASMD